MIPVIVSVGLFGILGGLLRFATGYWVTAHYPRHFFMGTLAVNIVGCLVIGYLYGAFLTRPDAPLYLKAGLIVGFVGGLTTFSSFSLDTLRLLDNGQVPLAIGYAVASVFGGLLATWAGLYLTKL
ncbi:MULTISPECIES: fluoride efflux transporter CrcB [Pseudomonas]|uniref:Fluoride-specific ion channel FluC n=1 Tax=Pseudomonas quercus TaxID=2722792 RepID=A0ABX0Y8Q1_9PSED|nr:MULTISPECIES: fluoride efflux transporter CrcB [Pseudomonas]MBF7140760.1 fluoride efflux transporter CrcB [Pseudomonas sp. LY10J]NJO99296.1 fluoride efflux transporter CrcB [Pseudomonas quercus]